MDSTDMSYGMNETMTAGSSASPIINILFFVLGIALIVLSVASMWMLYEKAKKPGWASIVPIYNTYVMTQIAGRPWWWLLLLFVPFVSLVIAIMLVIDFVKSYGKGTGFIVLALFLPLIAYPIMAFDKNVVYVGPAGPDTPLS